jgi:succinate-acetate transporter protein
VNDFLFDHFHKIVLAVAVAMVVLLIVAFTQHEDTKCVGGYLFSNPIGTYASPAQILDENGKGIRCEK